MNRTIARRKKVFISRSGATSPKFFIIVSIMALVLFSALLVMVKSRLDSYNRQTFQYLIEGTETVTPKTEIDDPLISTIDIKGIKPGFRATKVFGNPGAKVKIVYFSDYFCSFCQRQDSAILKLLKKYPNDIYVIAKSYPDNDTNSKAFRLSVGDYCAYLQDNFWEYKNLVYRNFNKYEDGNELANYVADQLALDLLEFKSCMKDKNSIEESLNDISDADNLGAFVVPFMKVNNIELLGNISDGDLDRAVESEMAK